MHNTTWWLKMISHNPNFISHIQKLVSIQIFHNLRYRILIWTMDYDAYEGTSFCLLCWMLKLSHHRSSKWQWVELWATASMNEHCWERLTARIDQETSGQVTQHLDPHSCTGLQCKITGGIHWTGVDESGCRALPNPVHSIPVLQSNYTMINFLCVM